MQAEATTVVVAIPTTWLNGIVSGRILLSSGQFGGLRDEKGSVIFTAYKRLFYFNDTLQSKLHAIREEILPFSSL